MQEVRSRGFTLIELLVVIAIIAILAAILFPVFVRAKENARCTKCLNNMKQIGIAIVSYADDFQGKYPWALEDYKTAPSDLRRYPAPDGYIYRLGYVMRKYVKNEGVWHCPSDVGRIYGDTPWIPEGQPLWKTKFTSYGYCDADPYLWRSVGTQVAGRTTSQFKRPSRASMCWEHQAWHYPKKMANSMQDSDKLNVLYCDGHTQRVPLNEFKRIMFGER